MLEEMLKNMNETDESLYQKARSILFNPAKVANMDLLDAQKWGAS